MGNLRKAWIGFDAPNILGYTKGCPLNVGPVTRPKSMADDARYSMGRNGSNQ